MTRPTFPSILKSVGEILDSSSFFSISLPFCFCFVFPAVNQLWRKMSKPWKFSPCMRYPKASKSSIEIVHKASIICKYLPEKSSVSLWCIFTNLRRKSIVSRSGLFSPSHKEPYRCCQNRLFPYNLFEMRREKFGTLLKCFDFYICQTSGHTVANPSALVFCCFRLIRVDCDFVSRDCCNFGRHLYAWRWS